MSASVSALACALLLTSVAAHPASALAPTNDEWADAFIISPLPYVHSGNVRDATDEHFEVWPDCGSHSERSVWYRIAPAEDATLRFTVTGDFDTVLSLWVGNSLGSLDEINCSDERAIGGPEWFAHRLDAGLTYHVRVAGSGDDYGDYELSVRPQMPANDYFDDAFVIAELPYHDGMHGNEWAKRESDEPVLPDVCDDRAYRTVWYSYRPPAAIDIRATLTADFDIMLAVFDGNSIEQLTGFACGSGSGPGRRVVSLDLELINDLDYWFQASSTSEVSWGDYSFEVIRLGGPQSSPTPTRKAAPPAARPEATWQSGRTVNFAGSGSARAVAYHWDFGDGTTGQGPMISHTYPRAGEFEATLTVTSSDEQTSAPESLWVTADPVMAYAPLLYLHGDDGLGPQDPVRYIASSSLVWAHDDACEDSETVPQGRIDVDHLGSGAYFGIRAERPDIRRIFDRGEQGGLWQCPLDQSRSYRTDEFVAPNHDSNELPRGEKAEGFFLDHSGSKRGAEDVGDVPVFYEVEPGRYVIYWYFFAHNRLGEVGGIEIGAHEGDWEHIVVELDDAGRSTGFAYYRHDCNAEIMTREAMERGFGPDTGLSGTHPIVYVAKGSHASYWKAAVFGPDSCVTDSNGVEQRLDQVPDVTDAGTPWRTWEDSEVKNARKQGWYGYGGIWGDVGLSKITSGPLGPSEFKLPSAVPEDW